MYFSNLYMIYNSDFIFLSFVIVFEENTYTFLRNKPLHVKTNNLGFRPGLTQNDLYSHRSRLEAQIFGFKEEEGCYYLCSKIKNADQLCSYCTADLHLCFCL